MHGEGWRGDRQAGRDETEVGRHVRPRRRHGDAGLHTLPHATLAAHPRQQRHRAPEPRNPSSNVSGRHLPRQKAGAAAGVDKVKYVADSEWGSRRYLNVLLPNE